MSETPSSPGSSHDPDQPRPSDSSDTGAQAESPLDPPASTPVTPPAAPQTYPAPPPPPSYPQQPTQQPTQSVPGQVPPAGYAQQSYPQQGYAQQGYSAPQGAPAYPTYHAPPSRPTSSNAIVAFVLSILSWVVCPVIPAVVALVLVNKSEQEIAASQGAVTGSGFNTASKIISWINIGVYAAVIVIGGIFLLIAALLSA